MIKKFIIFGPPGIGKGTLATLVAKKYNFEHISTGTIFREEITKNTALGQQLKTIVEEGGYVEDGITNKIVEDKLKLLIEQNRGFILDGYPRTIEQAKFLFSFLDYQQFHVWILEADHKVILKRLGGRRNCPNCLKQYHLELSPSKLIDKCQVCQTKLVMRVDDQPQAIAKRLKVYQNQTKAVQDFLIALKITKTIDAHGNPQEVLKIIESMEHFES